MGLVVGSGNKGFDGLVCNTTESVFICRVNVSLMMFKFEKKEKRKISAHLSNTLTYENI